jgi:hypothetical protein
VPVAHALVADFLIHGRREQAAPARHRPARLFERCEKPRPQRGQHRRAQRGRLDEFGPLTGSASTSARSCAIQSLALIPPSTRRVVQVAPSAAKASARSLRLHRHRLERGAREVGAGGGKGQAADAGRARRRASAARPAPRAPARRPRRRCPAPSGPASRFPPRVDQPQAVAQPLHQTSGHEDRAFERIVPLAAKLPQHGATSRWAERGTSAPMLASTKAPVP